MDREWREWRMNQLSLCRMAINTTIPLVDRALPQLKTPQILQDSSARVTSNILTYTTHVSFCFFPPQSVGHQWKSRSDTSSTRSIKIMTLPVSWSPREKFRDSAKDSWLNHTCTSGASEGKASTTCAKHNEDCKVGTEDWLAQNFELCNDFALANCEIHQTAVSVFMPHQPTKVTRTTSIVEPFFYRAHERNQLPQTGSSTTTQSWANGSWSQKRSIRQGQWQCSGWRDSQDLWDPSE